MLKFNAVDPISSVYENSFIKTKKNPLGSSASKLSWREYVSGKNTGNFCEKDIILGQFKNTDEYENFVKSSLEDILERKERKFPHLEARLPSCIRLFLTQINRKTWKLGFQVELEERV